MSENIHVIYSRTVFEGSAEQKARFNELLKMATLLNDSCIAGEKIVPGFTNIIGDCWHAFYYKAPVLNENAMQLDKMQFDFMKELLKNEEYIQWHELTKGDELLSVLTSVSIAEQLLKSFQYYEEQKNPFQIEQLEAFQKQQQTPNVINDLPEKREYLKQISKTSIGMMLQENKKNIHHTKTAVMKVGTMDGKKMDQVPLSDQFKLARIISERKELHKIAELVGRFKKIATRKQKSKQKETIQHQSLTFGHELSRLLPSELGNYMLGHSKLDFLKRLSEQQTLVYNKKGKDRQGKGPIIVCMDESSSMTSIKAQSKAFCIALLNIAKKQKRDFAIIPFATNVGEIKFFRKGQAKTQDLIQFSDSFIGGGTNYELPLREALKLLKKSEFKKADLLFVTDGSSFLPSRFIEEFAQTKKQKQFECTSIVLTNLFNTVDLNVVDRFSDRVIEVNELFEAEDAFVL